MISLRTMNSTGIIAFGSRRTSLKFDRRASSLLPQRARDSPELRVSPRGEPDWTAALRLPPPNRKKKKEALIAVAVGLSDGVFGEGVRPSDLLKPPLIRRGDMPTLGWTPRAGSAEGRTDGPSRIKDAGNFSAPILRKSEVTLHRCSSQKKQGAPRSAPGDTAKDEEKNSYLESL
jgi:hypothetical protein